MEEDALSLDLPPEDSDLLETPKKGRISRFRQKCMDKDRNGDEDEENENDNDLLPRESEELFEEELRKLEEELKEEEERKDKKEKPEVKPVKREKTKEFKTEGEAYDLTLERLKKYRDRQKSTHQKLKITWAGYQIDKVS